MKRSGETQADSPCCSKWHELRQCSAFWWRHKTCSRSDSHTGVSSCQHPVHRWRQWHCYHKEILHGERIRGGILWQVKYMVLMKAHRLLTAIKQSQSESWETNGTMFMLETGIPLPAHRLQPEMAKRKNPDILEFWDLSLNWHHTCIYIHTRTYRERHTHRLGDKWSWQQHHKRWSCCSVSLLLWVGKKPAKKGVTFFKSHTAKQQILPRGPEFISPPSVKLASFSINIKLAVIQFQTHRPHKPILSTSIEKAVQCFGSRSFCYIACKCRKQVQNNTNCKGGIAQYHVCKVRYANTTDSANYQMERKAHRGTTIPATGVWYDGIDSSYSIQFWVCNHVRDNIPWCWV